MRASLHLREVLLYPQGSTGGNSPIKEEWMIAEKTN